MSGVFASDAVGYVGAGANVLPIEPGTKRPLVAWKQWQARRQTEHEVATLLNAHPSADIAIIMGPGSGGLIDIETDKPEGERWLAESGLPLMSQTAMWKSQRGVHRLYRSQRLVRTIRELEPGVEILAFGSYAVAPTSGDRTWLNGIRVEHAAKLPEDWYELFSKSRKLITGPELLEAELSGVREGLRNPTLAALVGHWITQGISETDILRRARRWARRSPAGTHAFTEQEAEDVAASIHRTRRRQRSPEREALMLAIHYRLRKSERAVLIGLVALWGELGLREPQFYAPHRTVAKYAGVALESVGPALRRLEEMGLIVLLEDRDPWGQRTTVVRVRLPGLSSS